MPDKHNIAVIGGGASSMIASIIASQNGHNITIFEKNNKLGKKILATGNGRCNITNNNPILENYHSQNINIVQNILDKFTLQDTIKFFESIGLLICEGEKSNRLYPMSFQASSVVELLEKKLQDLKVNIKLSSHITKISYTNDKYNLTVNDTLEYSFDKIIIATGSQAHPKLGGCKDGYIFAKQFKHNIITTSPTLVQLISDFKYLNQLAGVKFNGTASLFINKQKITQSTGDILFTKYGLSGSSILEISREVDINLKKNNFVEVQLDLLPSFSKSKLDTLLSNNIQLNGILNKKLSSFLIDTSQNNQKKIINTIKNMKLTITNTKGFDFAEVSTGGVDTLQINQNTLESTIQKNLYFCGEVLDVDGDCGGFNLQWAWSSGYIAGNLN
jgi:predicted Rossmann fold flavoprotein